MCHNCSSPVHLRRERRRLYALGTFQGENGAALSGAVRIYHNVQLQAGFAYGFRENMAAGHAGLRFGF